MHPDLTLALALADAADDISLRWFRSSDLPVEAKADDTPVSIADREVEEAIRKMIGEERPDHGVLGEEFGATESTSGSRWIVDPIDGTKNYIRGVPVYATLIALETDGVVQLGVASAPALGRRWWGVVGEGAWANGSPIAVSATVRIEDAFLSSDSYDSFKNWDPPRAGAFAALTHRCARTRGYGDFWSHVLVAEGAIDISVEPSVTLWDLAAPAAIVEAAGGRFTDLAGNPGPGGGSAVATNGILHDDVLAVLRSPTVNR